MTIIDWVALAIFIALYVVISTELINKTVAALLGAVLYLFLKVIDYEKAFSVIDWNVIFLLVSMMIIINITKTTGLFQFVAIKAAKAVRGEPLPILLLLSLITALFSAFLDNVTTVLILSPVIILIAVELGVSPAPFIICMAIASNIGGTATLIGDPPNLMIGSAANKNFMDFLINLGPPIVVILGAFTFVTALLFGKRLKVSNERKARIMAFDESKSIENKPLLVKCLIVLALVIAGFLAHDRLGVEASTVAMAGATILMLICGKKELDEYFRDIEWGTLFFFIGLFILVGGLVELGLIKRCADFIIGATAGNLRLTSIILLWVSGAFSAIVDNIPYVATMIPMIQDITAEASGADPVAAESLWWSLALGACLGGNGTLVGASANVVSASISTKNGYPITFADFTKYGALYTVVSLIISMLYLLIRY